jgi:hypothetical protein
MLRRPRPPGASADQDPTATGGQRRSLLSTPQPQHPQPQQQQQQPAPPQPAPPQAKKPGPPADGWGDPILVETFDGGALNRSLFDAEVDC